MKTPQLRALASAAFAAGIDYVMDVLSYAETKIGRKLTDAEARELYTIWTS